MNDKHTPGPWKIGTPPPNGEQTVGTDQGLMVAVATTGAGVQTKANARLIAAANPATISELLDRLEAVEKERDALRARIEATERQEPVGTLHDDGHFVWSAPRPYESNYAGWKMKLYLAPGAQPAPSVPDATWLPVPDKHPTFDPVDLQLADGSVLCDCLPQSDGDYWWKGPSGEVFIDPKYANVTHWRLAAAPESKP